jgi:hypothetical protein
MKKLTENEFEINKTTMRDLTPYEVDQVAGGSVTITTCIIIPIVIKTIITVVTRTTR